MPASIFAGSKVKTLKSTLSLNGGADVISSTVDPTAVAVDASPGSLLLNTTTGKQYRKNDSGSSTNWTEVGAGTSGINYITNPSAATNTTGWATYADAAGAIPVDGTGGSPTVTWTRSTTTPLRGAADFNFTTPGGGSVQGQGVSTDLIIDLADQAKVLTVTFDYEVLSGTYASGDLTCYLIADPTGTPSVIQPAGYVVQAATVGTKMRQIATFQTNVTGQTYRLCFHVASTSTAAYVLAVDNVSVGPQVVQYGAPVTDWQNYSMTVSGTTSPPGFGTQIVNAAKWRRVGDTMEITYTYNQNTAGTAGSGAYLFSLPPGFSIDTSKVNLPATFPTASLLSFGASFLGEGWYGNTSNGNTNFSGKLSFLPYSSTTFSANADTNTALQQYPLGSSSAASFASANFTLQFRVWIPILGWSSTVQMSNDTDTRVVAAKYSLTSSFAIPTADNTVVAYPGKEIDTHGSYNSVTGVYVIPVSGIYRATHKVITGNTATPKVIVSRIRKGGTTISSAISNRDVASGTQQNVANEVLFSANAGDQIDFVVYQTASGDSFDPNVGTNSISIERLSGPSAIAASETVAAFANQSSGQTIPTTSLTTVIFNNKIEDTHGSYNNTTGIFKVPVSGRYFCASALSFNTAAADTNTWAIEIQKNGILFTKQEGNKQTASFNARMNVMCFGEISAIAGDEIRVQGYQDTGSGRGLFAVGALNTFSIFKIGN